MILLVTNSRDLAVDAVIHELKKRGEEYVRLDIDLLREDEACLDPIVPSIRHKITGCEERLIANPKSILYRAPTHLRESSGHRYSATELLRRHQWTAFARSMMVFDKALWINHPARTFQAESKPTQLAIAARSGLRVPRTRICNHLPDEFNPIASLAVKALDSFLLRDGEDDLFFYTTTITPGDLTADNCSEMPVVLQELVDPKVDVRITVVGERCFAAETDAVVQGDWRRNRSRVVFRRAEVPAYLLDACRTLLRSLGLIYGAIDFARRDETYYFLEVNPTGEWGWIDELFNGEIAHALAEELAEGCR